ncbi:MAG: N-acetylneuraminate synthase family protein, partial [Patescibacteria group bacterium]
PWEWYPELKKITDRYGVIIFSTPFDDTAVDFLENMKMPVYKVASLEITDTVLLRKIAKTGKPVIISRGTSSPSEIRQALEMLKSNGAGPMAVLHCVSSYPSRPEEMNLKTIPDIVKKLGVVSGLSDHTLSISVPVAAAALGASIIEKHLTLRRSDGGTDCDFSLEPDEFKKMVDSIREVEKSLGRPTYKLVGGEKESARLRRSIFVVQDIKKGDQFTLKNVKSIRPGCGLPVKFFEEVIGLKARKDIEKGTPLKWKLIKKSKKLKEVKY